MKTKFLAWIFAPMVSLSVAIAQEEPTKPEPPPGRLLNRPPDFSAWKISYSYGKEKEAAEGTPPGSDASAVPADSAAPTGEPRISRVTLTVTKPRYHIEIVDTLRKKSDLWFDGTTLYTENNYGPVVIPTEAFSLQVVSLDGSGFPDLGWVGKETYVGEQKAGDKVYFIFRNSDGAMAWISADRRLPVAWRKGDETRRFQELTPPSQLLQMPAAMERESLITKATIEKRKPATLKIAK